MLYCSNIKQESGDTVPYEKSLLQGRSEHRSHRTRPSNRPLMLRLLGGAENAGDEGCEDRVLDGPASGSFAWQQMPRYF